MRLINKCRGSTQDSVRHSRSITNHKNYTDLATKNNHIPSSTRNAFMIKMRNIYQVALKINKKQSVAVGIVSLTECRNGPVHTKTFRESKIGPKIQKTNFTSYITVLSIVIIT